eukprot:TRINITY_DN25784_c0_g1_i1.p1 TRINITY_DN25784_c0_g1~~TRINITY_DN25784_c0_g1_i1.p1  ORF type:complete len:270 (+),score=47.04 TRINITY_DN25784_c0_g1_i1:34-810(+)
MLSAVVGHEVHQTCETDEQKLKGYDGFRTTIYGLTLRLEESTKTALKRRELNEIDELTSGFEITRTVLRQVESWSQFEELIKTKVGSLDTEVANMLLTILKFSRFMWETAGHEERRSALLTAVSSEYRNIGSTHSATEIDDLIIKMYGEFLVASVVDDTVDLIGGALALMDFNAIAECAFQWVVQSGLSIVDKPFHIATQGIDAVLPNVDRAVAAMEFILGSPDDEIVDKKQHAAPLPPPPPPPPPAPVAKPYRTVML